MSLRLLKCPLLSPLYSIGFADIQTFKLAPPLAATKNVNAGNIRQLFEIRFVNEVFATGIFQCNRFRPLKLKFHSTII